MTRHKTHDPRSVMASLMLAVAVAMTLLGVMAGTSGAAAGDTTLVGGGRSPSISANGRFVAFVSGYGFGTDQTSLDHDIFVRDRQTGNIELISVNSAEVPAGCCNSFEPSISANGRFVAFEARAGNLVPDDNNGDFDAFVRDRQTGTTELVGVSSSGAQARTYNGDTSISANGRFVAFVSYAPNLVANDTNRNIDVFVRDRQAGITERVSVKSSGAQVKGGYSPSISANGRFVAFVSHAPNLVAGDTNRRDDVFVHDRQTGTTERVSVSSSGAQARDFSLRTPFISSGGRFVAFGSYASNLVAGDTNHTWIANKVSTIRVVVLSNTKLSSVVPAAGMSRSSYRG